jgi:hypothetical protein
MTPFDFQCEQTRAQQDLITAQGDIASINAAAVQVPLGLGDPTLAGFMAAAVARAAAAQARVDAAIAFLPPPL